MNRQGASSRPIARQTAPRSRRLVRCGLWFLLLLSTGCTREKVDRLSGTVALVNDEAIALQELLPLISEARGPESREAEATAQEKEELKKRLLDQLIQRKMLLQEARRLKIQLTEREVREKFEEMKEGKSQEAFLEFLSARKITEAVWEKTTREDLLIETLLNQLVRDQISLTDDEILQYYNARMEQWQVPDQMKFRQIVVGTAEEAERLRRALSEGADFAEAARTRSQFSDRGAEGEYLSRSEVPEEFEPLFTAEIGSISEVIKTSFGYHLVKVEDRRPARTLPFEEVKEKIYQTLLQEKREVLFSHWIETVRGRTEVKINEAILQKIS